MTPDQARAILEDRLSNLSEWEFEILSKALNLRHLYPDDAEAQAGKRIESFGASGDDLGCITWIDVLAVVRELGKSPGETAQ